MGAIVCAPDAFWYPCPNIMTTIGNNLQQVRARIDAACAHAGRGAGEVSLLAVSKTFGPEAVRDAALAGQLAFGENYV